MARRPQLEKFASTHGLKIGSIADLIRYRLETEKTVARIFERDVETHFGSFHLVGYRDASTGLTHFALTRGVIDDTQPVLARVHASDAIADVLHLKRADSGLSISDALRHVARRDRGVVVVLGDAHAADSAERFLRSEHAAPIDAAVEWRRHGLGAKSCAIWGARRLVVLGTPRRFLGQRVRP